MDEKESKQTVYQKRTKYSLKKKKQTTGLWLEKKNTVEFLADAGSLDSGF